MLSLFGRYILASLVLTLFGIGTAFATPCASGGPVSWAPSPPFPSQFVMTGRKVGDVLWQGSIVVSMNGCKYLTRTDTTAPVVVSAGTSSTTGVDLYSGTDINKPSGLGIRAASATAFSVAGLPAGCGVPVAAAGQTRVTVRNLCPGQAIPTSVTFAGTTVTFPDLTIYVKDPTVPTSTLQPGLATKVSVLVGFWVGVSACNGGCGSEVSKFFIWDYGVGTFASGIPFTFAPPQVVTAACTLTASNVSVTLPTVSTSALAAANATAGRTPFNISLTGCSNGANPFVASSRWTYTQGGGTDRISNTAASPAANVETQILDSNGNVVSNGGSATIGAVGSAGGAVSQTFFARYVSNGVAGPGAVIGVATFTLNYN